MAGIRDTVGSDWMWRVSTAAVSGHRDFPLTYTNWHHTEPNQNQFDNICMMLMGGFNYTWGDHYCSRPACAACEVDM